MKEINILLLGEVGVGKSTFINALLNYLSSDELSDAMEKDLSWVIPAKFVMTDSETFEPKIISIGNDDKNEARVCGQSSTQSCRCYNFPLGENTMIRIIDTPGIADIGGIDEDVKKFQNIMACISNYDHLHGICLFLRPNAGRMTILFRYCIKELLKHLHRSAANNIVFCFTNVRTTCYRSDPARQLLAVLLRELRDQTGVEVPCNTLNTFVFDNESFRFLVAHKQGIPFGDDEKDNNERSWNKSVEESIKLIHYIASRPPHRVRDTLFLNETRRLISVIAKNIQPNLTSTKETTTELNTTQILTSACTSLMKFLHQNSIISYNDDLILYVQQFIREEEHKMDVNSRNIIDELRRIIVAYEKEFNIYRNTLDSSRTNHSGNAPSLQEIEQLIDSLCNLPHIGSLLRQQVNLIRQGYTAATHRCEIYCKQPQNSSFFDKLKSLDGNLFS